MNLKKELLQSVETGLINKDFYSDKDLRPQLLLNDYTKSVKLLNSIIDNLKECDSFIFSVAFITKSGLLVLKNTLLELEKRNIKGKIITTDYLHFNQPEALRELLKFSNIEVKFYTKEAFHIKGYIFNKKEYSTMIIGSSNITQEALLKNKEWNMMISSFENGELFIDMMIDFEEVWADAEPLNDDIINEYEKVYINNRRFVEDIEIQREIKPNKMQKKALLKLSELRDKGENKGLVISATGTGKTYLSAFDVQQCNPRRLLFVVHRANIAHQAMLSFKTIITDKSMGMIYGKEKDLDLDYVFATIQTMSKDEMLQYYSPDDFDYIIIDEVHRSGASSYIKLLNYFKPQFLLGMTATPERTDGYDIFSLFDNNIAFEIRLKDALEEDILAPFHYFGIADIISDNYLVNEDTDFNMLTSDERVNRIIDSIDLYSYSGNRPKGLIFCSRVEEAKLLSLLFNQKGFRTISVDGGTSEGAREKYMGLLESKDNDDYLDFIFSVDVFNEGIDIQSINMIIMLRPTQSAIIFVQQLGRGLRKYPDKEYLVVLDFIGNYNNNFMIPIALYGDRTFNKDNLRKFIHEGNASIPGCTTINFDEISKEKIYESINQTSFRKLIILREEYNKLKNKLNKIPMMMDFYLYGYMSPLLYIDYSNSYYDFIKIHMGYEVSFNTDEVNLIRFVSRELINTKRLIDIVILKELLNEFKVDIKSLKDKIKNNWFKEVSDKEILSSINTLNGDFLQKKSFERYNLKGDLFRINEGFVMRTEFFHKILQNELFKFFVKDTIDFGYNYFFDEYYSHENERNGFYLYKKYSRKDVSRILKWERDFSATMFGYMVRENDIPIFVTYHKDEAVSASTNYQDFFISRNKFNWMSKNNRNLRSKEIVLIKNQYKNQVNIPLFVKKSDDEGSEFYFIGNLYFNEEENSIIETHIKNDNGKELSIVNIEFSLKDPVKKDIYKYITKD